MQLFAALTFLATAGVAFASPLEARANTCFDGKTTTCLYPNIVKVDKAAALGAIQQACSKLPTCVPGTAYNAVTGKTPGYTATLILGKQCAGVTDWNLSTCTALYLDNIDAKCGGPDNTYFYAGYIRSACDDTFVSFNLGG